MLCYTVEGGGEMKLIDIHTHIYPDKIAEIAVEVEYRDGFNKCDVVSIERLPATFVPGI